MNELLLLPQPIAMAAITAITAPTDTGNPLPRNQFHLPAALLFFTFILLLLGNILHLGNILLMSHGSSSDVISYSIAGDNKRAALPHHAQGGTC